MQIKQGQFGIIPIYTCKNNKWIVLFIRWRYTWQIGSPHGTFQYAQHELTTCCLRPFATLLFSLFFLFFFSILLWMQAALNGKGIPLQILHTKRVTRLHTFEHAKLHRCTNISKVKLYYFLSNRPNFVLVTTFFDAISTRK